MNSEQAIEICNEWLRYLDRQEAKTKKIQGFAALARNGPAEAEEARRELRKLDRNLSVYDGARLRPAVERLTEDLRVVRSMYDVTAKEYEDSHARIAKLEAALANSEVK